MREVLKDSTLRLTIGERWFRVPSPGQGRLSGYELKNHNFTGFAPGGEKSVWRSRALPTDSRLVLTESAVDALSFHQLHPDPNTRYMSTAGTLSDHQREVIRQAIAKMPPGSTIVLAFDNDKGGKILAEGAQALAPVATFERPLPSVGKDWNNVLEQRERDYILALPDPRRSQTREEPSR